MRIQIARIAVAALLGSGVVTATVVGVRYSMDKLIAESQQSVVLTRPCPLNTDLEISLEKGQAVQLEFGPNPYGLVKYILYYYAAEDGQGILRGDTYLVDGRSGGGGSRIDLDGALRQLGRTPCLAIIKWDVRGGQLHASFRVSDDLARNRDEYRQYKLGGKRMSIQYSDHQLTQ